MKHWPTAALLVFLIYSWKERCIEVTPLKRPKRSGGIGVGISCIFLTGSLVYAGRCAVDVHTGIVATSVIPGRMTIRFPAVDEHTVPS